MGSSDPPYLYDRPTSRPISFPYSHFDPKAVSRASIQQSVAASRPTTVRNGPLIDFNRHPDSYMVIRGQQVKVPSLPKNTKRSVAAVRWTQFSMRLLQLLSAMAALFCGVTVKPPEQIQSWTMRIAPGYDILITLYALYHLLRSSKHRTPSSSASYHVFALVMDTGLVPLYTFIAIFNYFPPVKATGEGVWFSMFPNFSDTLLLVTVSFITACSLGGLHLVSMGLDLYLIVIFRKIARMPPDMNPLEDNLTSRKASKHKHKNSELSLASTVDEKTPALQIEEREVASPYGKTPAAMQRCDASPVRQIPFGHSRAPSDLSFSPHNPRSAHLSRQHLGSVDVYKQRDNARQSAVSLAGAQSFVTANSSVTNLSSAQQVRRNGQASPARHSKVDQKGLLNDNWYVVDDLSDARLDAMNENAYDAREPRLPQVDQPKDGKGFSHQPLRMNPPTPSLEQQQDRERRARAALGEVSINRSPTVTSNTTVTSSVYSESAPSLTGTKTQGSPRKFYGDLTAAARGIRGYAQVPQKESDLDNQASPSNRSPVRVLSRSGVDVTDASVIPDKSRRRLFSGKRAEEGMAGLWR